jgi:hypothetical protein
VARSGRVAVLVDLVATLVRREDEAAHSVAGEVRVDGLLAEQREIIDSARGAARAVESLKTMENARSSRITSWIATFRQTGQTRTGQTRSGWQISPISGPQRAGSASRSSWTSSPGVRSVGQ